MVMCANTIGYITRTKHTNIINCIITIRTFDFINGTYIENSTTELEEASPFLSVDNRNANSELIRWSRLLCE